MARKTYATYGGPVAWQNSPSTATPQSAANLNVADNALAAGFPVWGQLDQDEIITGTWKTQKATAGGDIQIGGGKDTTTGKEYGWFIAQTSGNIYLKNITDNVVLQTWLAGVSQPGFIVSPTDPGAANFPTGFGWVKDS